MNISFFVFSPEGDRILPNSTVARAKFQLGPFGIVIVYPAQSGLDFGNQDIKVERLLNEIVGTKRMDITISVG